MRANSVPPEISSRPPVYTAGTLQYDRLSIAALFDWLLWGDFAFTFFEQIFGRFMPLYLKEIHTSNTLIGITTGRIAGLVNVFFLPNISQWSDRLRSRWGRRIPLLLVVAPLTAFSLIGIGFAPEISAWVHRGFVSTAAPSATPMATLLTLLCACAAGFHFFNMVLVNAFNWLLRDVVPQIFMARFLSWFRVVGTVAIASLAAMAVCKLASYYLISSKTGWLVFSLAGMIPGVTWGLSSLTLNMQIFPGWVFGQFFASLNVFGSAGVIVGNYFIGQIMDWTDSRYQYVYLWCAASFALALIPMCRVYRDWKKFGGPDHYTAPIPEHMLQD